VHIIETMIHERGQYSIVKNISVSSFGTRHYLNIWTANWLSNRSYTENFYRSY